jgi:calcium-dependent protein kinase
MDHPHVARLFDVYESDERLYLVMESLEGGELFDRLIENGRFSENDAAEAIRQMLLALSYVHGRGIVHCDVKLENFLYDCPGGSHLKLIDFGFSKHWKPGHQLRTKCGTTQYVAPEVLCGNYTSQSDLWSLGVIAFTLLSGKMPFGGTDEKVARSTLSGNYQFRAELWDGISSDAKDFVQCLLDVNPQTRLTARAALEHKWIADASERHAAARRRKGLVCGLDDEKMGSGVSEASKLPSEVDASVVDALCQFGRSSKFRRCCLEMMAWSLSNEERATVREHFLAMDTTREGTITLPEFLEAATPRSNRSDGELRHLFEALDSNDDQQIHYSDFLAAMVSTKLDLHDGLLLAAFQKFDADGSGYITTANLKDVLGETFKGERVETLLQEADLLKDNKISFQEFVAFLRGTPMKQRSTISQGFLQFVCGATGR